jgi:hypothetical protein
MSIVEKLFPYWPFGCHFLSLPLFTQNLKKLSRFISCSIGGLPEARGKLYFYRG